MNPLETILYRKVEVHTNIIKMNDTVSFCCWCLVPGGTKKISWIDPLYANAMKQIKNVLDMHLDQIEIDQTQREDEV